ncbi:MAG TPA: DNA mismatch repair protein MutS [Rhodoferax sp.]
MLLVDPPHALMTQPRPFHSVLYPQADTGLDHERADAPDFFHDLQLDQVVGAITAGQQEYDLAPFFQTRLHDLDAISYRQEIMRDMQNQRVMQVVQAFAQQMHAMREQIVLANKRYDKYEKERWFLEAVSLYCAGVARLAQDLSQADPQSPGLRAFTDYLARYVESALFCTLATQAQTLVSDLSAIRYSVHLRGLSVTVRLYDGEIDYSADVEATFDKFKRGAVKDYRSNFPRASGLNDVEAQILDQVALLNLVVFTALDAYCAENVNYLDHKIAAFDREIQFYVAYLEFAKGFEQAGLAFCYPQVSQQNKEVDCRDTFDLALASKLVNEKTAVVRNDFFLRGRERIFVVSGANQGGKTTFARTFGQLHYLACLGCPVPGTQAKLFLFDHLLCHFEREEDIHNLQGKLQDDLVRMHQLLDVATPRSIVIMNEIFSSTSLQDAVALGRKVMARISQLDLLCVCVSFLDELANFDDKTVSLVSTVDPNHPATRTFKVERRPADGLSYALAIAEKYRLTYTQLQERILA